MAVVWAGLVLVAQFVFSWTKRWMSCLVGSQKELRVPNDVVITPLRLLSTVAHSAEDF